MVLICQKPGQKKARRLPPYLVTTYLVIVLVLSALCSYPNALIFITTKWDVGQCAVFK